MSKLTYRVSIFTVHGETTLQITTSHTVDALLFLNHYDHEGSALSLKIIEMPTGRIYKCEDAETIYALLEQTNWDNIFPPEGEGGN